MSDIITKGQAAGVILEKVFLYGDLSKLTPSERTSYMLKVCDDLGINPSTRPFQLIMLNGKLTLYPTRDCADQLRRRDKVSVLVTGRETVGDIHTVYVRASTPDGRQEDGSGSIWLHENIKDDETKKTVTRPLSGSDLANVMMKCETKAKRRVTLAICGLGWTDETEWDSVKGAKKLGDLDVDRTLFPEEVEELEKEIERRGAKRETVLRIYGNKVADPKEMLYKHFRSYMDIK